MSNQASNIVTTRWQNKSQLAQRIAKLEKGEDKLINGDLSGTSPKPRAENMPELLENQTGDLGKREQKREIIKSLLIWKFFTYSSVQKKENCVFLTRLNFQTA
jgi:coproporphyrinogen III oxidase-like Fe-S oxidoreductase